MESVMWKAEYYEALKALSKTQGGKVGLAVLAYAFDEELPKLNGAEKAVFSLIKAEIDREKTRSQNGKKGGAPRGNQNARKNNLKTTIVDFEKQPKNNHSCFEKTSEVVLREKEFPIKELPKKEKVTQKENNPLERYTQEKENYIPPFYSPQGEEKNKYADEFFTLYPRYAKDRAKMRIDVDYKRLIEEFGRSQYLRSLYTVKQINDIYALILSGDFRDKEKQDPYAGVNARAERERWYSERKAKAEGEASKILNRFMQDEEFKRIHKRLNALIPEIAKAEYQSERGDDKAKKQLVKLTQEQEKLRMQYRGIIERNGKTEEDLRPKWHCKNCLDTGFLSDGRMCDCYEGGKT